MPVSFSRGSSGVAERSVPASKSPSEVGWPPRIARTFGARSSDPDESPVQHSILTAVSTDVVDGEGGLYTRPLESRLGYRRPDADRDGGALTMLAAVLDTVPLRGR